LNFKSWPASLKALGHRNFRIYFSGQLVSLVGTWMQNVAMSWLAYRIGHLVWLLGAITFFQQIPMLVLAPFTGVLLDRIDRLRLLRVTQSLSIIPALLAAILTFMGHVQVWQLMVLAGCLGLINAVDVPARQSLIVGLIADREALPNAIAMNSLAVNSARLVGPAIAGLVVALIGEAMCFLLNAISYLAVVLALFRVRMERASPAHPPGTGGIREGWAYAAHRGSIRTLLLLVAVASLLVQPYTVVMPYYARDVFGGDSRTLGVLLACSGAGALCASAFLLTRPHIHALVQTVRWSAVLASLAAMAFSHSHVLGLSCLLLIATGFGMIATAAACNTLIQSIVPDALRGRVMALYSASFIGVAPVGSLLVSSTAQRVGVPDTLLGCGLIAAALSLALGRGLRHVRADLP
jgi:MFS family permease